MSPREQAELLEQLRALAAADEALSARPGLEAELLAALRAPRRRVSHARTWTLAAVAAVLALSTTVLSLRRSTPSVSEPQAAEFVPLVYGDPLADVDAVHVVRVAVARSALAGYGLPVSGRPEASVVSADVLVGQDGLARAIRFVSQD